LRGTFGLSLGWGIRWISPSAAVKMTCPEAYSSCPNSSFTSNSLASCNLVSALGFMSMVDAAVWGRERSWLLKRELRFSSPGYTRVAPRMASMDIDASPPIPPQPSGAPFTGPIGTSQPELDASPSPYVDRFPVSPTLRSTPRPLRLTSICQR
jgi:hypothetical protein